MCCFLLGNSRTGPRKQAQVGFQPWVAHLYGESLSPFPGRKWETRASPAVVPSDVALVGCRTKYVWKEGHRKATAGLPGDRTDSPGHRAAWLPLMSPESTDRQRETRSGEREPMAA